MKTLSSVIFTVFIALALSGIGRADTDALSWDKDPSGIWVAMEWVKWTDNHRELNGIRITIKNASASTKYFAYSMPDKGFHIYFSNPNGTRTPLHSYGHPGDVIKPVTATMPPIPIDPGKTISQTIILRSSEVALLSATPIACEFYIADQPTSGYQKIASSPRALTAISIAPP